MQAIMAIFGGLINAAIEEWLNDPANQEKIKAAIKAQLDATLASLP